MIAAGTLSRVGRDYFSRWCIAIPSTSSCIQEIVHPVRERLKFIRSPSTPFHPRYYSFIMDSLIGKGSAMPALVWVRGVRRDNEGVEGNFREAEEVPGGRSPPHQSSEGSKGGEEPIPPSPPPRSRAKAFIIAAVLSFALTSILFGSLMPDTKSAEAAIPADAPHVDFATFIAKFLRAGEVQKILFLIGQKKAVATLHPGAVIDGKPFASQNIVISYENPPPQFWADVRKVEEELGIPLQSGVEINILNPVSGWKVAQFMLGMAILGFLATGYGRLIAKRIAEERAKKAAK